MNLKTMDTFFQFKLIERLVGEPPMSHKPVWAGVFLYLILVLFPLMILNKVGDMPDQCIKHIWNSNNKGGWLFKI